MSPIRVLIVDDHLMMRDGLSALIGVEPDMKVVAEASHGREAINLIPTVNPEVVVMDLGMPEMNGVEATRQIVAAYPNVSVVFLSTHIHRGQVMRALDAGAMGYVAKSEGVDELLRAIRSVKKNQKYLSPSITGNVIEKCLIETMPAQAAQKTLGARESEVLQLIAEGFTSGEIASRLHISTATVDTHRRNIMRKLHVHTVAELTKYAIREGLTPLET